MLSICFFWDDKECIFFVVCLKKKMHFFAINVEFVNNECEIIHSDRM